MSMSFMTGSILQLIMLALRLLLSGTYASIIGLGLGYLLSRIKTLTVKLQFGFTDSFVAIKIYCYL